MNLEIAIEICIQVKMDSLEAKKDTAEIREDFLLENIKTKETRGKEKQPQTPRK